MNSENIELDRIDRRILQLLQDDAHMTYQQIAEAVSLSPSPCLRRIKRLEQAGVIKQYVGPAETRPRPARLCECEA
jgi:Lrp/AsnC family transcriptional regulator, leucine-responsive regulatory protein